MILLSMFYYFLEKSVLNKDLINRVEQLNEQLGEISELKRQLAWAEAEFKDNLDANNVAHARTIALFFKELPNLWRAFCSKPFLIIIIFCLSFVFY